MNIIGIPLRKPSFNEITAAAVMATGLWLAMVGLASLVKPDLGAADAARVLAVVFWGAVSARVGIRIGQGGRHLLANVAVSALLLAGVEAVRLLLAGG